MFIDEQALDRQCRCFKDSLEVNNGKVKQLVVSLHWNMLNLIELLKEYGILVLYFQLFLK